MFKLKVIFVLENEVTVEQLKDINDNILKELCPKVGLRIILKKNIDEYLTSIVSFYLPFEHSVYHDNIIFIIFSLGQPASLLFLLFNFFVTN